MAHGGERVFGAFAARKSDSQVGDFAFQDSRRGRDYLDEGYATPRVKPSRYIIETDKITFFANFSWRLGKPFPRANRA